MPPQPYLFCFGLGYVAMDLAKTLLKKGWKIGGTCQTMAKCQDLLPYGINAHIFTDEVPLQQFHEFSQITHLLMSIPPGNQGDKVLAYHQNEIVNLKSLRWVGYLSTTGVYGDYQGAWVDEQSTPRPYNQRLENRLKAESQWLTIPVNSSIQVFRLAGIYGPARNVLRSLQTGKAKRIDKPGQVFSRIHVSDITQILEASIAKPQEKALYNCADDLPAAQAEVVAYGAKLLGILPPPLIPYAQAELSPMAQSFYQACRRVGNSKIKKELNIDLHYPDYRAGLKHILATTE